MKYSGNKCYKQPVGVCFLTDNFIVRLDTVAFPQSPKLYWDENALTTSGYASLLRFGLVPMLFILLSTGIFWQTRKRKAEKAKLVGSMWGGDFHLWEHQVDNYESQCWWEMPICHTWSLFMFFACVPRMVFDSVKYNKENWSSILLFWKKGSLDWMAPLSIPKNIYFFKVTY